MGDLLSSSSIMRAAIFLAVVAVASGAPKFSKKALSTPLARGGGKIVGGTEASPGEFPHQIALLRGGVGGSLMCGGSLVGENMVVTAGHCCDGQSTKMIPSRLTLLSRKLCSMRTTTPGPLIMTSVFWSWNLLLTLEAPRLEPSAFPLTEKNTALEPSAPCLGGAPPPREAALLRS